jgi:hypothetical protein
LSIDALRIVRYCIKLETSSYNCTFPVIPYSYPLHSLLDLYNLFLSIRKNTNLCAPLPSMTPTAFFFAAPRQQLHGYSTYLTDAYAQRDLGDKAAI